MKRCIRAGRLLSAPSRTPGISLSCPSTRSLFAPQQAGNLKIGCEFRRLYLTLKGEFTCKHLTTHFLAYREPNVPSFRAQASIFWWDRKHRVLPLQCNYDGSDCIYCHLIRRRSLYWIPAREVIYWNINKYNGRGSESGELIKIYKTPAGPRLQWIQQR